MLTDEILNNWAGQPKQYVSPISSLTAAGYEAWTIKNASKVGVAIPLSYGEHIHEQFASAELFDYDLTPPNGETRRCLILLADGKQDLRSIATLCTEFVIPGPNGRIRKEISSNPVSWWLSWKELLGNKSVNERVYDVIAELSVLAYLAEHGEFAEWNGPNGAEYDIDCDKRFVEVKSTTALKKKHIVLNNMFQLIPPDGRKLDIVLCQLEPSIAGRSINGLVEQLVDLGYNGSDLNNKLSRVGFDEGKTARNRCYVLHAMTEYHVDDSFPAIRNESFVGGKLPQCVESISYTLSLDGIEGTILFPENGGSN